MLQKWHDLFLVIVFISFGCTPTLPPEVIVTNVHIPNHQATEITGTLYRPNITGNLSCLLFANKGNADQEALDLFVRKIVQQGFVVLVLNLQYSENPGHADNFKNILASARYLKVQAFIDSTKIAVMGTEEAGVEAIRAVAVDSTLAGVISLCSPANWSGEDAAALAGRMAPKPMVVIASDKDPNVSISATQRLYDMAGEPKKLVWLSTRAYGTNVLSTDLEPVVRQVTLLFLKKYLK